MNAAEHALENVVHFYQGTIGRLPRAIFLYSSLTNKSAAKRSVSCSLSLFEYIPRSMQDYFNRCSESSCRQLFFFGQPQAVVNTFGTSLYA